MGIGSTVTRWREVPISDLLTIPAFNRISDYFGVWAMEPGAAAMLHATVRSMDMMTHVYNAEKEPTPVRCAVEKVAGSGGKTISVISLSGILMKPQTSMGGTSTVAARREVRNAAADAEVGAILLRVDSPGGTSAGTDDLAQEVRAAAKKKPVWAYVDDLAASAAVWAISGAANIYANSPTALYGSIGTYQVLYDASAAGEASGEKTILVSTGPLKGLGVYGTKITPEQVAHVQGLVNSLQVSFDTAVQNGRGLSAKELAAVRHGGVITAEQAIDAKLIDGIQSINKTIAELSVAMKEPGRPIRSDVPPELLPMRNTRQLLPMRA